MRRFLDSPWFYYTLAGLLLLVAILSQIEIRVPSRPVGKVEDLRALRERKDLNVIFILIDTLRADHLGSYGYARDTSPIMDELAQVGVRFARVRSQSTWTKQSMASLWRGAYPVKTGVNRFADGLPDSVQLPAEILRDAGFYTGGIYRNGWVSPNFGFGQGFDLYVKPVPSRAGERYERARADGAELQGTDLDVTEAAVEFLRSHASQRFFLYLHYMDAHQYLYAEEFALFGTAYKDAYDNAIRWTDRNVAQVISELDELGLFEKTIIVIASDHGEAFLEHGIEGHARDLHAEVANVPLIISLPFRLDEPLVVEPLVRNIDIWPTLFDLLGLPPVPGAEGQSLLPLIEATAAGADVAAVAPKDAYAQLDQTWGRVEATPKPLVALDEGEFRLMYWPKGQAPPQLYDTRSDPGEQQNIAKEQPEKVEAMSKRVEAFFEQKPDSAPVEVEVDDMMLGQLRALGYVLDTEKKKDEPEATEGAKEE